MADPHDWPLEQSARGTLRPFLPTSTGYLLVLFSDPEEAQRAQQALKDHGAPGAMFGSMTARIQRIASRLEQEQRIFRNDDHGGCWRAMKQMTEQASIDRA